MISARPNINSTIEEIENYEPKNWADSVSWFSRKQELIKRKTNFWNKLFFNKM